LDKAKLPKAGGLEVKATPETVERLRKRVLELAKIDEYDPEVKPALSFAKIGLLLHGEFPELSKVTVKDYCRVVGKIPQKIFDFYTGGRISFSELNGFGHTTIPKGDLVYIAEQYVAKRMNLGHLRRIKGYLRAYNNMGVDEAIRRATGKLSAKPEVMKRINKSFDTLLDEAIKHMTLARARVAQLLDLLPVSTLNKGKVHGELFNKVYLLRHILGEQYEFVDKKVKTYLDELVGYVSSESQINELRKRELHGGAQHGDGQGTPVPGAG